MLADFAGFFSRKTIASSGRRVIREIIAHNLSKAGWSWGCVSAIDSNGRTIWIADAHRDDGKRFVVHADEKLTAFVELKFGNLRLLRIDLTDWQHFFQTQSRSSWSESGKERFLARLLTTPCSLPTNSCDTPAKGNVWRLTTFMILRGVIGLTIFRLHFTV
jgi:hypothetical protein